MIGNRTTTPSEGDHVVCIACGDELPRGEAREYDKYGDRWDRDGKEFEYLCKDCDADLCHYPRDDLEATLVEAGAGTVDRDTFLAIVLDRMEAERA